MVGMTENLRTPTFDEICAAKYVSLTTFTKDGRAKPAPVWAVADNGRLLVWTEKNAWKVRRIRNTPRVTLAVCDVRGHLRTGAIEATASVLDNQGSEQARSAISRKYGLIGWLVVKGSLLRRGSEGTVGLAITADA